MVYWFLCSCGVVGLVKCWWCSGGDVVVVYWFWCGGVVMVLWSCGVVVSHVMRCVRVCVNKIHGVNSKLY